MSKDYGEPWHRRLSDRVIVTRFGTASFVHGLDDRAIVCVNAVAGIPDPAAFVQRAKAMEVFWRVGEDRLTSSLDTLSDAEIAELAAEWKPDA